MLALTSRKERRETQASPGLSQGICPHVTSQPKGIKRKTLRNWFELVFPIVARARG